MQDAGDDRARGVLLGLAAGDRNGGPIRMALQLARSLAELRCFDAQDVLRRYLLWWHQDGADSGPTTAHVFELIDRGLPPNDAVIAAHAASGGKTAGCNPAHRSTVLGMATFIPKDQLAECARLDARLTHYDPLAGEVAAAVVLACRSLIEGAGLVRLDSRLQSLPSERNCASGIARRVCAGCSAGSDLFCEQCTQLERSTRSIH